MKKILSICAFLLLCTVTLFAQSVPVSKTSQATNGVFKTDVDNFTNVNAWQNVDLNNMFTSISYSGDNVELGFAKKLENSFLGMWLIGDLGFDFKSTSKKDTSDSDGSTTDSSSVEKTYTEEGKKSEFTVGALFGKGDMAYKASIYYKGNAADRIYKESSEGSSSVVIDSITINNSSKTESEEIVDMYNLRPEFSVGLNGEKANYYGTVALDIMKNTTKEYSYKKEGDQEAVENKPDPENDDTIAVTIGGGASFNLKAKENLSQKVAVDTGFVLNFIEDDVVEDPNKDDKVEVINVTKYNYNSIFVKPTYSFKYDGDERLTVGFNAYANMVWNNSTTKYITGSRNTDNEATRYTNSESENKNFSSVFKLTPYASLAIAYDVIPSKLTFNASTKVSLPTLNYTWTTTKTTTNSVTVADSKETNKTSGTDKSSTFTLTGVSVPCTMNFNSGFTYNLSKNLTFDATWNIVGDLFTNTLNSSLTTGNTNIMNNLNKILVHNVSLGITFKM